MTRLRRSCWGCDCGAKASVTCSRQSRGKICDKSVWNCGLVANTRFVERRRPLRPEHADQYNYPLHNLRRLEHVTRVRAFWNHPPVIFCFVTLPVSRAISFLSCSMPQARLVWSNLPTSVSCRFRTDRSISRDSRPIRYLWSLAPFPKILPGCKIGTDVIRSGSPVALTQEI
jgi:hypothetical protein